MLLVLSGGVIALFLTLKYDRSLIFPMTVVGFFVGFIVAMLIGVFLPLQWVPLETRPLVNLRSNDGISGRFFLGSGTVGTTEYYFYYTKNQDGGFEPNKLSTDSNKIVIFEEDRSDGELRIYEDTFTNKILDYIAIDLSSKRKYEFHIPLESLTRDFHLQ